ncbi:MAG: GNAT family N-acetyltransferase [Armatimonadetes bacterium]|nr:GNAT family N-acetyltransferase [Armatimonadota bacterium]
MSTATIPQSQAEKEKKGVALSSVGAAVLLTVMKLVVGLMTGSLGILSEAAHSGLDLIAAVVTYFAVRISDKPADADHLYGHAKVENLSAFVETLLLLATCGWIVYEAVERLFFRHVEVEVTVWAFAVILVSILIDITRSRALLRVAKKHNSQALEADALHFSTDVWSSSVVLIGLGLVKIGEYSGQAEYFKKADALAALGVAVLVIWVSVRLGKRTIDVLLDRAPTGMVPLIEQAAVQVEGVLEVRRVRLRQSGHKSFVDLVVAVGRELPTEQSHAIAVDVVGRIQEIVPESDVVVHTSPTRRKGETIPERIRTIAESQAKTIHNIQAHEERGLVYVDLHMEVDESLDIRQAHAMATDLEKAIRAEMPNVTAANIHIESRQQRGRDIRDVTASSGDIIEKVRGIASLIEGVVECHGITVRRSGSQIYLAMHCTFDDTLSIREAHEITTDLEDKLAIAVPGLARALIHPEPVLEVLGESALANIRGHIILRPFDRGDAPIVRALAQKTNMESDAMERMLSRATIVMAELGDAPAGYLAYRVEEDIFNILRIPVAQGYHRLGIGRRLLAYARDEAAPKEGCTRIRIRTTNDNVPALRLYQKFGFRITAIRTGILSRRSGGEIAGWDSIPIRDEIELEMELTGTAGDCLKADRL